MRYLYLFSILLIASKTFAAAATIDNPEFSNSALLVRSGVPSDLLSELSRHRRISALVHREKLGADAAGLKRKPDEFAAYLGACDTVLHEAPESVTRTHAKAAAEAFSYLVHCDGGRPYATAFQSTMQILLDRGLVDEINYPGSSFKLREIPAAKGMISLLAEGLLPRFNSMRMPCSSKHVLFGGGRIVPEPRHEGLFTVDLSPEVRPDMVANIRDPRTYKYFSNLRFLCFEHISMIQFTERVLGRAEVMPGVHMPHYKITKITFPIEALAAAMGSYGILVLQGKISIPGAMDPLSIAEAETTFKLGNLLVNSGAFIELKIHQFIGHKMMYPQVILMRKNPVASESTNARMAVSRFEEAQKWLARPRLVYPDSTIEERIRVAAILSAVAGAAASSAAASSGASDSF